MSGGDEPIAGVAQQRRTRVTHQRDRTAGNELVDELVCQNVLVMIVECNKGLSHTEML